MSFALEIDNLYKSYSGGFLKRSQNRILKGVSFKVERGKVTGFLGANGVGKTTLLKCVIGLSKQDSGEISILGEQFSNASVLKKVGFLPERPYFYKNLKAIEFLEFCGLLSGMSSRSVLRDRIKSLLKKMDLYKDRHKYLRQYSKGMLQKIGLIQAILHSPELIVLDEPMSGLDPDGRFMIKDVIQEEAARGAAIFFSSHLFYDVEVLCSDLVVLRSGELLYSGLMEGFFINESCAYVLSYKKDGVTQKVEIENLQQLQKEIDRIRAEGCEIISVDSRMGSLEEMFRQKALS